MSVPITPLPLPFTVNVIVDARSEDVEIRVDPTVVFVKPVVLPPGETIKYADLEDQDVGIALHIQKGSALSFIALLTGDKPDQLFEALVTCMVRGDPEKQERAEALLERFERAVKTGFETPARVPGGVAGCVQVDTEDEAERESRALTFKAVETEGGENAQAEGDNGRSEDDLSCGS